jgi:hypothetical protein
MCSFRRYLVIPLSKCLPDLISATRTLLPSLPISVTLGYFTSTKYGNRTWCRITHLSFIITVYDILSYNPVYNSRL